MTEEMYELLYKIISDRAENNETFIARSTYRSVLCMLEDAHTGDIECLRQFDYYGEEA